MTTHYTTADTATVIDLLDARGLDRFVVKAADGLFVADTATAALDLLTTDDSAATLYASCGNGEMTKVINWDGTLLRYEPRA